MTFATATILSLSIGALALPLCAQSSNGTSRRTPAPAGLSRSVWDGVYTLNQAKRGAALTSRCVECHGPSLNGKDAPTLVGAAFTTKWNGWTLGDMFERLAAELRTSARNLDVENVETKEASADDRESRQLQESADVLAHILHENRFPAGETELPASLEFLRQVRFQASRP